MKACITGVTGFVGRALAALLQQQGWDVVGTSRHSHAMAGVTMHVWDASQPPDPALLSGVDVLFHLAGKAHALAEHQQQEAEYDAINVGGTERLLAAAHQQQVSRVVYVSSVKAVGEQPGVMDTSVTIPADTPYGRSKRKAEQLVLESGLVPEVVVLRPTMIYGATTKGNLPRMIRAIHRGFFPPLPDQGARRSMVHVEDVAQALLLLATHADVGHQIYIVHDGEAYSVRQIHDWVCAALQRPAPKWTLPPSLLHLAATMGDGIGRLRGRRFPFDSDALQKLIGDARYDGSSLREIGFSPRHTLRTSMADIVRFVVDYQGVSPS